MEKFKVTFEANDQQLKSIGTKHASDTYADIEATFVLGSRWTDMDSVSAVWWNDFTKIATALDSQGKCIVPHEVLTRKGCVRVNLVGSIVEGDELVTRLTSYSAEAVKVNEKIKLTGTETSEITPSQFEQFVAEVKTDADRAEAGATASAQSAQSASESATASANSASDSAQSATASAQSAQNASESAISAENAKDDAEDARDEIRSMRANAETLEPNQSATASYSNGVLTLGIPKGDKGDTGDTGASAGFGTVSASVDDTVGTPSVEVTTSGTDEAKNFAFAFHNLKGAKGDKGDTGEVSQAEFDEAVTDLKSNIEYITPTLTWTAGEYIDGTGIVQSGSGRSISGFVPCLDGETIKYIAETNHANVCGISFWDANYDFVSGDKNVGTIDTEQTATVPSGGCFARLSIKTNTPDQTETAYLKINRMSERDVFVSKFHNELIKSVSIPSGFTWATSPLVNNLYKVGEEYIADLDVADYKPKGTRYYVDPINGDDGRSGKLVAYPLKTIQAAYSKTDVAEICLYPANYYLTNRFSNTGKSIAFTTVANTRAKFVCGNKMTWTQLEGYTKIWQAALNNANTVVSDVVKGDVKYSLVYNWASLEATEHAYRCTNYTVFVHSDGAPSEDVMVLQRQLNGTFRFSSGGTAYVENIDFIGGVGGACEVRNTEQGTATEVKFYAKNCSFSFGTTTDGFSAGNGLRATGLTECIIQDCEAKYNTDDGFNYHIDYSGQECNAVEINCVAHDNGISGGTDNGSTTHDGAKIIRINTECYNNNGPNIADVNDGTQSVNYGCKCKNSGVNVNYNAQDGTAEMWLYDCDASESLYAISVGINSASTVHVRAGNMDGLLQYGSTAVIDSM